MPDPLRDQYRAALERIASKAGISPEELEQRLERDSETLEVTSDCITLSEIDRLCDGEFLGAERVEHIQDCQFCCMLLEAMSRDPNKEMVRQFVEKAATPNIE